MHITQNKKRIKVQHVVGQGTAQFDVVRDLQIRETVIVDDVPVEQIISVRKIADVDAEIVELDYEILPNKVIVKGKLHKQIYYIAEGDNVVREYTIVSEEFTDFVHIEGAKPGMDVMLDAKILYINTDAANGSFPTTTIHQNAVLSITAKVIEILQLDVVTDVTGPGITVEKELFKVESVVGEEQKQKQDSVVHTLDRPARKVKEMDAVCRDMDYEILPNKVVVRGTLHKQIYYVDPVDDAVQEQSFDTTFNVVVDIPGAQPGMDVYTRCKVEFCEASLLTTNNEEVSTRVKANCILQVFVKVTEMVELNLVTNVKGATVDRRRIRVEDIIGKECHQENVSRPIDTGLPVKKTKELHAKIRNVSYEKIQNKVIVKGDIHVQAYYVVCGSEVLPDPIDNELRETSADVPFTTFVHFDGVDEDTMIDVTEKVEYTDLKLEGPSCDSTRVRAVAIIEICVRAFEMKDLIVVVDVKDSGTGPVIPDEECPPEGYYSYTIKAGDTLAKVAASYQDRVPGLTWQDIVRANPGINPNRLRIGQVIKIPCVVGKG
ncbi:MAG: SPOCS domain-containing protein [Bacillota bacterium]